MTASPGAPGRDRLTLFAVGVLVALCTVAAHEAGHLFVSATTGLPMPSVDASGQDGTRTIDDGGALLVGLGGMLGNLAIAAGGWALARSGLGRPTGRAVIGWFAVAHSLWLLVGMAVVSPLFEVGDWMVIVDRFPNRTPLRATIVVTGLFSAGLAWRATTHLLPMVVGNGRAKVRRRRAGTIVGWSWLGGAVVAFGVLPLGSPVETSALVTTWPILLAFAPVDRVPVPGEPLALRSGWPIIGAAAAGLLALGALVHFGVSLAG